MGEICRIRKEVLRADIRLDANDAHSTRIWVSKLQSQGDFVYYKDKRDPSPEGSDLADNLFALCIQTKFQKEAYERLGNGFLGIDATHNVTQYKGILLFTLMARDNWGHGVPVAWMLSSNGTQLTIEFFLNLIKAQCPQISPSIFMTDRDQAQINAIRAAFPECQRIFYCWWHVLRAIRTHFNTKEFPDLWELIQDWVHVTNDSEFNAYWTQIWGDTEVPKSVAEYIARDWLPQKEMWSAMSRQNRTIFEEGDTNMLLELYVITHFIIYMYFLICYQIPPCAEKHMAGREKKSARRSSDPYAGDRVHPGR
jgi:hypothetical protein